MGNGDRLLGFLVNMPAGGQKADLVARGLISQTIYLESVQWAEHETLVGLFFVSHN